MAQIDSLHLRDAFGRWTDQMTVCGPVSKRVATEIASSLSARNRRATFERILETFPITIQGVQIGNGSEFRGEFGKLLQEQGIVMQPQTEWLHRALPEQLLHGALQTLLRDDAPDERRSGCPVLRGPN